MTGHTIATALVKSQKAHKRKAADFYPTPVDVTVALMQFLQLGRDTVVWEPASGDGSMSRVIERHCDDVFSSDMRDESSIYGERGRDFLNTVAPYGFHPEWIITNPPFNVAEAFIRKSLTFTPNVAMLLSNQYWHAATRVKLFRDHPPAWVLPLTWRPAFLEKERGKSPMMNVIWVVWQDGSADTRYALLERPKNVIPLQARFDLGTDDDLDDLLGGQPTIYTIDPELEDLL